MAKVEFGWGIPSGPRDAERKATYMEDLRRGFDLVAGHMSTAWFIDHLQFNGNDLMEGWTALTYLAAMEPRMSFGHAVLCQSFRNPAHLAKMAATLHYMSGGRFIFGIGAGWKEDEYIAYGYDFPPAGMRVDELDEALRIVKAMWQEDEVTFEGKHFNVREARCEPKPNPLPTVMVGAMKPRMIRLAVRHADWWNVSWTGIADFRKMVKEEERACEEEGRDPATLRRTWHGGCACAPTEEEAKALTGGRFTAETAFVGTPQQIVEQMMPFVELGMDYFILGSAGFPDLTTPQLLIEEVLPALNR